MCLSVHIPVILELRKWVPQEAKTDYKTENLPRNSESSIGSES
jgi:hypothetical protein